MSQENANHEHSLDEDTIEKIAKLARLSLTSEEQRFFAEQLTAMLSHFRKIAEVNTVNVDPLVTPSDIQLYLREDRVEEGQGAAAAMVNAPEKSGNLFKVPPVV